MDEITDAIDTTVSVIVMHTNGVTREEAGEGWHEIREQVTDLLRLVKAMEKTRHQKLYEKWDDKKNHICGVCN